MKIRRLHTADETEIIQKLAKEIWPVSYSGIISEEQIEYMLERMYAFDVLAHELVDLKYVFLLLEDGDIPLGFAVCSPKSPQHTETWRLHKLYVSNNVHGKGFGKALLTEVENLARLGGAHTLELNVNKQNPAIHFYKVNAFTVARKEVNDIGRGFVMDDYVMEKAL